MASVHVDSTFNTNIDPHYRSPSPLLLVTHHHSSPSPIFRALPASTVIHVQPPPPVAAPTMSVSQMMVNHRLQRASVIGGSTGTTPNRSTRGSPIGATRILVAPAPPLISNDHFEAASTSDYIRSPTIVMDNNGAPRAPSQSSLVADDDADNDHYHLCAHLLDHAIRGIVVPASLDETDIAKEWRRAMRVVHGQLQWFISPIFLLYLIMSFHERPSWCWNGQDCTVLIIYILIAIYLCSFAAGYDRHPFLRDVCPPHVVHHSRPSSAAAASATAGSVHPIHPSRPTHARVDSRVLKLVHAEHPAHIDNEHDCSKCAVHDADVHTCVVCKWMPFTRFKYPAYACILTLLGFLDVVVSLSMNRTWRISPLCRPLLSVMLYRPLRHSWVNLLKTLWEVRHVMLLFGIYLATASWIGMVLFLYSPEHSSLFVSYLSTLKNLQVLLTAANFPDVMMPAYNASRSSIAFFVVFIFIGMFFNALILGLILTTYQSIDALRAKSAKFNRRHGLNRLFLKLLRYKSGVSESTTILSLGSNPDALPRASCANLIRDYLESRAIGGLRLAADDAQILQRVNKLDAHKDGRITHANFMNVCDIMKTEVLSKKDTEVPLVNWIWPGCDKDDRYLRYKYTIDSDNPTFCFVMQFLGACCVGLILLDSSYMLSGQPRPRGFEIGERFFVALFVIEAMSKIATNGIHKYLSVWRNNSDALIALMTLSSMVLIEINPTSYTRYCLVLRCSRFISLLEDVSAFRVIFATVSRLLIKFAMVFCMLITLFDAYSTVGIIAFGGLVTPTTPALAGTPYDTLNDYANNFNDKASSMVTLFMLLGVSSWYIIQDAYIVLTSNWARVFFVSFYVLAVLVTMNLIIALVLDSFTKKLQSTQDDEKRERAERLLLADIKHRREEEIARLRAIRLGKSKHGTAESEPDNASIMTKIDVNTTNAPQFITHDDNNNTNPVHAAPNSFSSPTPVPDVYHLRNATSSSSSLSPVVEMSVRRPSTVTVGLNQQFGSSKVMMDDRTLMMQQHSQHQHQAAQGQAGSRKGSERRDANDEAWK